MYRYNHRYCNYSIYGIIGIGTSSFVLYREVSFIWRLKCTGMIGIGTSSSVLYREVSFIWRLKCTGIIGIGTSSFVLYIERCPLFRVSFIRGSTVALESVGSACVYSTVTVT